MLKHKQLPDNEMNSDESWKAGSRPEVIDEFVISKWGQGLQNNIRIYCTKSQALREPCKKPRRIIVLWCGVWCLDLPSHPFTLEPCLLTGWFFKGNLENSGFKSLSQGLLCLTHCVVSHWWVTNLWLSFHILCKAQSLAVGILGTDLYGGGIRLVIH